MYIGDIMSSDPITLNISTTVKQAAQIFLQHRIDGAVVLDENCKIAGLFTKSHLYRCMAEGWDENIVVSHFMKTDLIVGKHDDLVETILIPGLGRLPVLQDGTLVGMVTRSDLATSFYSRYRRFASEMETILQSLYNIIISIDNRGILRVFNAAAEINFGINASDAIGRHINSVIPENSLLEVLSSGDSQILKTVHLNHRKFICTRTPVIRDGKIIGAVSVLQDASELEKISRELQNVEELNKELNAIIESSYDGLFITDGDGIALRINKAFERISGISAAEFYGHPLSELVENGIVSDSTSIKVLDQKKQVTVLQHYRTGVSALSTGSPVFDDEGNIIRVVTNVRDLTELNDLKQKLDQVEDLNLHYMNEIKTLRLQYHGEDRIISQSAIMRNILDTVVRIAQVESTVLITGESGTGKELIADAIHANSPRRDQPFLKINCGAIPLTLLESELFGYSPGAFTGARRDGKAGYFELADAGTLLLDEIGELPLDLQVKLLRVLQTQEIMRIGSEKPQKVDVRIIAATNRNLQEMIKEKGFRLDLYYRLNVVPIDLPPLRERLEDVPILVNHFLERFNQRYNMNKKLSGIILDSLTRYKWPGNIRELENIIERLVVISADNQISIDDLPAYLDISGNLNGHSITVNHLIPLKDAHEEVEKQLLTRAAKNNRTTRQMAQELGVNASTIVRKAARYGIDLSIGSNKYS